MAQPQKSARQPTWTAYITLAVALVGVLVALVIVAQGLQSSSSDRMERPVAVATSDAGLPAPQAGALVGTPTAVPTIDPFVQNERDDVDIMRVWHG
jgi:phosphohistidine swiveling domain-containing protein